MQKFIPGQRWISDAETELGLGTILKVEHRTVTIVYLASGELRTYASDNAPLTRVWFDSGDRIRGHDQMELIVNSYSEEDGILTYNGVSDDGREVSLDETELDNFLQFNRPSDKLLNAQFERERVYYLRLTTRQVQQQLAQSKVNGLCGARAELIPHQLYIAHETGSRLAPRVLLADEVGLGKTIEAGLILQRQLTTAQIQRVLIVVPEPLLHQWLVEMRRRFNLPFAIIDENLYDAEAATDGNPFIDRQLALCSLPFLLSDEAIRSNALAAAWDTVVVDEAHHIDADAADASQYKFIAQLAGQTPSLLLLTATPEQLGQSGHFARLQLLDPDRFPSREAFATEEQGYLKLAEITDSLLQEQPLSDEQQAHLQRLGIDDSEGSAQTLVSQLIDRHGTGRVMFRNTRAAVSGFPRRVLQQSTIEPGDKPLIDWLGELLSELAPARMLLICSSVERVTQLQSKLREQRGIHAATFHEHMSIVERDRAAEYFANDENGSSIMLCSEIGSEGRNFQFLQNLVLLDLPASADLLEQRIGRLDRIGQADEITIHVPVVADSRDAFLLRWYHEGLNAFEQTCQTGAAVQAELQDEFDVAISGSLSATEQDDLLQRASDINERQRAQIEQGRDRLLELSSHRADISADLITEIDSYDTDPALQRYMERVFDNLGIELEDQSSHTFIIRPGDHMAVSDFPGLPEDGCTITYRRHIALAREEVQFLSWEHPLVRTAMDQIVSGGFGQVTIGAMQHESLPRGSLLLESHYTFDCPAPASLGIGRYLDGELLRVLCNERGQELGDSLSRDELDDAFRPIKPQLAKQLVRVKRGELAAMLEASEQVANQRLERIRTAASENADQQLSSEIERLQALARHNRSVREDEIKRLQQRRDDTIDALTRLRCVLDLVRVFGVA